MAWIEFHQTLVGHPKTKRLARALGIHRAQAVGHLAMLWCWCLDYAPDGDLARYNSEDIAEACGWDLDAEGLVNALAGAGFLERDIDAECWLVHDWRDYAGRLIEQRESGKAANAERQRKKRERDSHNVSRVSHGDVTRDSHNVSRPVTGLPYLTVPNQHDQTRPNPTGPNQTPNMREAHEAREVEPDVTASRAAPKPVKFTNGFAGWYAHYPKKQSRVDAEAAWAKLKPDDELIEVMTAAAIAQSRWPGWLKDGGAFIPLPATWLNGRKWEDEPPRPVSAHRTTDDSINEFLARTGGVSDDER